jgi:hypothetical protein
MSETHADVSESKQPEVPRSNLRGIGRLCYSTGRACYKVLVDVGPIATLLAIVLTNYYSYKNLQLSRSVNRAELVPRDVLLYPLPSWKLGLVVVNAGSRPAHLLEHGSCVYILGEDVPPQDAERIDCPTNPYTTVVDKAITLITVPLEDGEYKSLADHTRTLDELRHFLAGQKQKLVIRGKLRYFDGFEPQWMPYCKVLSANVEWQDCSLWVAPRR